MCVYIYIIYIYILSSTDRLFLSIWNSSVWLDTQDARSRDRNPSNFTLDLVSDRSANMHTTLAKGIFKALCSNSSSSKHPFVYIHTLSATRVLNSFEELCIMRAATENSFARVLNPHGGAYMWRHTALTL